jgi:hypothetical protein
MKTKLISMMLVILAMIFLTNCGETSKKDMKSAKDNIEDAGENLKQAEKNSKEEVQKNVKAKWEKFRAESETIIENTDIQIKELREKITQSGQKEHKLLTKELDSLELKNKILKDKLAQREYRFRENLIEFNEWAKEKQHKFEEEFKQDIQEIEDALKKIVTPTGEEEDEF